MSSVFSRISSSSEDEESKTTSYMSVPHENSSSVQKIQWSDVNLTWKYKYRSGYVYERKLLTNQSGEVCAGQLLAIMGPTGCGKTSLLNVLSGRLVKSGKLLLTGTVNYENESIHKVALQEKAVCVMQDDMLFPHLTVKETMLFAAHFHSPSTATTDELNAKADKAIAELNLTKSADTMIGSYSVRGISGGEYKRVLIGKELMKTPSVVFLDEPTAGLDAHQALAVMKSMKTLASHGRIVVAVIHQPRSSIVELFDRLLLLSEGRVIYFGLASQAVPYFASAGYRCPAHFNPADYLLDVLSLGDMGDDGDSSALSGEVDPAQRLERLAESWVKHTVMQSVKEKLAHASKELAISSSGDSSESSNNESTFKLVSSQQPQELTHNNSHGKWLRDFCKLCERCLKQIYRDVLTLQMCVGTVLFFAALLSLIYRDLGDSQRNINDRIGLLYFLLVNQVLSCLLTIT